MRHLPSKEGFPGASDSKESSRNAGDLSLIPGLGRSPEEEMATGSNIFAWRIPWTVEPGRLLSTGSQRVGHTEPLSTHTHVIYKDVVVPFGEFFSSQRVLCL